MTPTAKLPRAVDIEALELWRDGGDGSFDVGGGDFQPGDVGFQRYGFEGGDGLLLPGLRGGSVRAERRQQRGDG